MACSSLYQCKDELTSFKFLHMLMQLYNYRELYASELTNLQVQSLLLNSQCGGYTSTVFSAYDIGLMAGVGGCTCNVGAWPSGVGKAMHASKVL